MKFPMNSAYKKSGLGITPQERSSFRVQDWVMAASDNAAQNQQNQNNDPEGPPANDAESANNGQSDNA
ncbi:MAG: hypothetical protein ACRD3W_16230, partial [Terriglobales bacterium]